MYGRKIDINYSYYNEYSIKNYFIIRAGINYLREKGNHNYHINKLIIHPEFNHENYDYDISVIIINNEFTFSEDIKSLALPSIDFKIPYGSDAAVTGWGMLQVLLIYIITLIDNSFTVSLTHFFLFFFKV